MGAVLVVDDDVAVNRAIARVLEDAGHEVVTAMNGREAITLLNDGLRPAVILLDFVMPIMNGWQVLDHLTRDRELQKIPIILTSTQFGKRTLCDTLMVLAKPFSSDRLLELVDHHCGARLEAESIQIQKDVG